MSDDFDFLELDYQSAGSATVLEDYIRYIANRKLLEYQRIIQTNSKEGQSLWAHIMNLVTTIEKLRPLFDLSSNEMRCLLLALTAHDINKLDVYGKRPDGNNASYANAAVRDNIEDQLEALEVTEFFPEWRSYRFDIKYLADAHQVKAGQATQHNLRFLAQCQLDEDRLEGPLRALMRFADTTDNSHSGDHDDHDEKRIRTKLIEHLNAALYGANIPRRYRFIGHRLAEQRGLLTNVIHNCVVTYLQGTYGKDACIDVLYHAEGVDYLLDQSISLAWTPEILHHLAKQISQKCAELQSDQVSQFIKAKPSGISVDDAAMQSGASIETLFILITGIVVRKRYRQDWWEQRQSFIQKDLETALVSDTLGPSLRTHIVQKIQERHILPLNEEVLKRGEFVMAYRNFLKDHRAEQLKVLKQDAWVRVYRLFQLPNENDDLYRLIDPFRRGYGLARDLPTLELDDMMQIAIEDLELLDQQANEVQRQKEKPVAREHSVASQTLFQDQEHSSSYLVDYLERHLEMWDSREQITAIQPVAFLDSLRRYTDAKRPDTQCCHCGSPLKASEWMSLQVPSSIGVQSFSNRLEGGSTREPKRNVCEVCRTQFILEKLAWRSHRDKQGNELVTYYVHLFPYSFYTQPLLQAWWQSIERFRKSDHVAVFLNTRAAFLQEKTSQNGMPSLPEKIPVFYRGVEGVGLSAFSETLGTTPVFPLVVTGKNSSEQFLLALGKTVLLARWFGSRILLSRLPTPLLNLSTQRIEDRPVALAFESIPSSMEWLVPNPLLTTKQVQKLEEKLHLLHHLAQLLAPKVEDFQDVMYDIVSAAAIDVLSVYHVADRLIEKQVTRRKGARPEYQAIELSQTVAGLLEALVKNKEKADA